MIVCTPEAFIRDLNLSTSCQDHHWTGNPSVWQAENEGSVAHIEGQILFGLARAFGGPVLEIGSDLGISTRYIHEGLEPHPEDHMIYAVDPMHKWDDAREWRRRVRVTGYGRSCTPPWPCRWVFCDGDHRAVAVREDIRNCLGLGIQTLVFHDTAKRFGAAARPTNTSDGSEAREAVLDSFDPAEWDIVDILSPCGLLYVSKR